MFSWNRQLNARTTVGCRHQLTETKTQLTVYFSSFQRNTFTNASDRIPNWWIAWSNHCTTWNHIWPQEYRRSRYGTECVIFATIKSIRLRWYLFRSGAILQKKTNDPKRLPIANHCILKQPSRHELWPGGTYARWIASQRECFHQTTFHTNYRLNQHLNSTIRNAVVAFAFLWLPHRSARISRWTMRFSLKNGNYIVFAVRGNAIKSRASDKSWKPVISQSFILAVHHDWRSQLVRSPFLYEISANNLKVFINATMSTSWAIWWICHRHSD